MQRFNDSHLREPQSLRDIPEDFLLSQENRRVEFFVRWNGFSENPRQLMPINRIVLKIARRHLLRHLLLIQCTAKKREKKRKETRQKRESFFPLFADARFAHEIPRRVFQNYLPADLNAANGYKHLVRRLFDDEDNL